jgi:FlaA1/EpsC-like NDP-sugar epimerase
MIDEYALLGRDRIDIGADGSYLAGRRVLVTGAGGSIGSVLCRHLARCGLSELVMLDRDESALHAVQLALTGRALLDDSTTVLADIRDKMRINRIFMEYRPDVVFHVAALKHQPLLERYPEEAMKTNVVGTRNVLLATMNADVGTFVNVSTDKAANPSCVLGASKRIAERIVAWYAGRSRLVLSVRFGNVINSRGSVSETFGTQIAAGTSLTITSPTASRFFMTGDEAAALLIHAPTIAENGQVLVMDMGQPVRIVDIAERLIKSAGRGWIEYTGLRAGEKNAEDLLGIGESDRRPRHPLISQVDVPALSPTFLDDMSCQIDAGGPIGPQLMAIARVVWG